MIDLITINFWYFVFTRHISFNELILCMRLRFFKRRCFMRLSRAVYQFLWWCLRCWHFLAAAVSPTAVPLIVFCFLPRPLLEPVTSLPSSAGCWIISLDVTCNNSRLLFLRSFLSLSFQLGSVIPITCVMPMSLNCLFWLYDLSRLNSFTSNLYMDILK